MAINFPTSPTVGSDYSYQGIKYTYQADGYWAVTTVGTQGVASPEDLNAGTDSVKYLTPTSFSGSKYDITISNFGSASQKDVGTAPDEVPTNSDLGTAAVRDVGTAAGDVMEVGAFGLGTLDVKTIHINFSGSDVNGDGSYNNPYKTLGKAFEYIEGTSFDRYALRVNGTTDTDRVSIGAGNYTLTNKVVEFTDVSCFLNWDNSIYLKNTTLSLSGTISNTSCGLDILVNIHSMVYYGGFANLLLGSYYTTTIKFNADNQSIFSSSTYGSQGYPVLTFGLRTNIQANGNSGCVFHRSSLVTQYLTVSNSTVSTLTLDPSVDVDSHVLWLRKVLSNHNTTVDGLGFIRSASPIVKLYADKIEANDYKEIEDCTFERVNTGHYIIKGAPLLSRDGWYIETLKDRNNNIYFTLDYEELEDGLHIRTYEPDYSTGLATNGAPVDINEGRFVTLRFEEDPSLYPVQEEPTLDSKLP